MSAEAEDAAPNTQPVPGLRPLMAAVAHLARLALATLTVVVLATCTYMNNVAHQEELARRQKTAPSLTNLKRLLDSETHYIYGRILGPEGKYAGTAIAVAAYANAFGKTELVDIMHSVRVGTHYGLHIPRAGDETYRLRLMMDRNGNGQFDKNEVVGARSVSYEELVRGRGVLRNIDISLSGTKAELLPKQVPVERPKELARSLFFPAGAIRELDDPVFDRDVATLGVYEPAAFSAKVPTGFYALEEEIGSKIPVIFVHGMGGTPREFAPLVERLDRRRFKPWFFYYASGMPLDKTARLFHGVYLSGDAVGRDPRIPKVIIAHSMGGVVVREALNLIETPARKDDSIYFTSIASPLAGHPSAASGEEHGMIVVPSWRSLNPSSAFIKRLYRKALPKSAEYKLVFAFRNTGTVKLGENSDGTVPISSQLRPEAQAESSIQRGFNATHTGILADKVALDFLLKDIHRLQIKFPPDHIEWIFKGGFVVKGPADPRLKHFIETQGQYFQALALGKIEPIDALQRHFVEAVNGRTSPNSPVEEAWIEFSKNHPNPTPNR